MKEKIIKKIQECCPELGTECKILGCNCGTKIYQEPQLNHLLLSLKEDASFGYFSKKFTITKYMPDGTRRVIAYDLTKTVEQNLENEELANFIGNILFD
jgi:hypothetical protein